MDLALQVQYPKITCNYGYLKLPLNSGYFEVTKFREKFVQDNYRVIVTTVITVITIPIMTIGIIAHH